MSVNKFDEAIRKKLEGFEAEPAEDVWAGIESALNRKARWGVIRRVAGITAAAAACLVAGLLVFNNGGETAVPSIPDGTVAVVPETAAPEIPAVDVAEEPSVAPAPVRTIVAPKQTAVPSIEEQIRNISEAVAENTETVPEEVTSNEPETPQTPVETPTVKDDRSAAATASVDWNAIMAEDEEESSSIFGTPIFSISSNLTSNASSGGFSPDFGPGRSPSREGSKAAAGLPVPIDEPRYYMPLSFGVQLKLPVSRTVSFGIGADYTYIVTRFTSLVNAEKFDNTFSQLHYVGIPVGVYANLLQNRNSDVYVSLGGSLEKCVGARYVYGSHVMKSTVPGLQFSAMAGIGVEYWLAPSVGLYLDPSLVYYFPNERNPQPLSIRTAEPLQIRFEAGMRFRLRPPRPHHGHGRF